VFEKVGRLRSSLIALSSSDHYNFMTIGVFGVLAKTPFLRCERSQLIEAKGLAEREGYSATAPKPLNPLAKLLSPREPFGFTHFDW
jgi:hypothetical protein